MVLALSTSAQAALTLSLSPPSIPSYVWTLSVISDDTSFWLGNLILSEDIVNWTEPVAADWGTGITTGIGNIGNVIYDYYGHAAIQIQVASNLVPSDVVAGTQFSIQIIGKQYGTIYISLQDDTDYHEISSNGPLMLIIPEPITIVLLGLGGLMIRRRRKI
jgi:hypothetical protein